MKLIAEFCQNHNGNFDVLKRMIHEAAEGGATHGKIQSIYADDLSFRPEFEQGLVDDLGITKTIKRPYKPEYERLKGLELSYADHEQFIRECDKAGLVPLTTAFTISSINWIKELGFEEIKVASYDCGSLPLIKALASNFNNLIISTGATYDEEIKATVNLLDSMSASFDLLHCVTIYPTPLNEAHINRMNFLKTFARSVGFSDHTLVKRDGVKASMVAIYCGAEAIERHFTVLPEDQTRDGPVSITKAELKQMVEFLKLDKESQREYINNEIPEFNEIMGSETRPFSEAELLNRAYYRGRFSNKLGQEQIFNWEPRAFDLQI